MAAPILKQEGNCPRHLRHGILRLKDQIIAVGNPTIFDGANGYVIPANHISPPSYVYYQSAVIFYGDETEIVTWDAAYKTYTTCLVSPNGIWIQIWEY